MKYRNSNCKGAREHAGITNRLHTFFSSNSTDNTTGNAYTQSKQVGWEGNGTMFFTARNKAEKRKINTNIPAVQTLAHNEHSKTHDFAVVLISALLWGAGFNVNYHHVNAPIPKSKNIPLKDKNGKIFDVAFELNNCTILIEIKVMKNGDN